MTARRRVPGLRAPSLRVPGLRAHLRAAVSGDEGSATVLTAWIIATVAALVGVLALVIGAYGAAHRAQSAADLAALAGAGALADARPACAEAAGYARANGATLDVCGEDAASGDVVVTVSIELDALTVLSGRTATATARAGPVE